MLDLSQALRLALPHLLASLLLPAVGMVRVQAADAIEGGQGSQSAIHRALPSISYSVSTKKADSPLSSGQPTGENQPSTLANPQPASASQTQSTGIQLTINSVMQPALQLEAQQAPLSGILKQFAEKTGAIIHYSVLPDEPVTATCAGDSVKAVMECLLGNKVDRVYRKLGQQDAAITPVKTAGIPKEEIWILGARYGSSGNMSCTLDVSKSEPADNEADLLPQQALMNMAQIISDPRYAVIGKQALSMLAAQGKTGDPKTDAKIVETLEGALKDKSPEARAQAVFGLSQQDSSNTQVLHEALQDTNADVRLMAVDSAKADTQQGQAILNEALNDSDETVRALAEQKLNAAGR